MAVHLAFGLRPAGRSNSTLGRFRAKRRRMILLHKARPKTLSSANNSFRMILFAQRTPSAVSARTSLANNCLGICKLRKKQAPNPALHKSFRMKMFAKARIQPLWNDILEKNRGEGVGRRTYRARPARREHPAAPERGSRFERSAAAFSAAFGAFGSNPFRMNSDTLR